jgi:hypothetical protein
MKKPRLWTWALIAVGTWTAGFIYNVYLSGYPSWLRWTYNQKVEIAESINQPKVILAGGSGVHFTINSEAMEEALGMPVVNLGTNGGIGLDVMLSSVLDLVKPGDIMLVIPEYSFLLNEKGLDELSPTFGLAIGRPRLGGIAIKDFTENTFNLGMPSLKSLVKTGKDLLEEGRFAYYNDPLSKRGDATIELERSGSWWEMTVRNQVTPHTIKSLQQFRKDVEQRGGTLVLSLPVIYGKKDERTLDNLQKTVEALSEVAPTLYNPETFNIETDSNLFADTHYHLKIPMRVVRSQQLAEQLRETLPRFSEVKDQS